MRLALQHSPQHNSKREGAVLRLWFCPEGSQAPPPKAHPDQQQENEMGAGPPHQG